MPKKILLADDSVTIQKVVSITLAHEDFDLTIVDNGSKAISKAKELKPDVILLDVVMPDKDGYQVCQEIKGNADLRSIPIILLTGTFEPFDADKAAEVGADDFIKKPFESHTLINKVKEMASRSGVVRGKPVDISSVDIDFETPVEAGYQEKPVEKVVAPEAPAISDDLETAWEAKSETVEPAPRQEGEDIWSVEEFEDISGIDAEARTSEKGMGPSIEAEPEPAPKPSMPKAPDREPPSKPAVSDEFFVREGKPSETGVDDFELGEEISEDELEKFLEEETADTEINIGEETEIDELGAGEDADVFLSDETGAQGRRDGEEIGPLEDELFVEDFEESPSLAAGRPKRQDDEFLMEESLEEEPIELDWEDEPLPETKETSATGKAAGEFETLIRRKVEDELSDFARGTGKVSGAERRPATQEFEVDLSSFEEEPDKDVIELGGDEIELGREEIEVGQEDSKVFDFGDLTDEISSDRRKEDISSLSGGLAQPVDRKNVSQAVDKVVREVIEKVVWEVVPELAEELIKQEIKRLKGEKS